MISFICNKGIDTLNFCDDKDCKYNSNGFCDIPPKELLKYIKENVFKDLSNYTTITENDKNRIISNFLKTVR